MDETVTLSEFDKMSADGRKGMKASFWNNRTLDGDPIRSLPERRASAAVSSFDL